MTQKNNNLSFEPLVFIKNTSMLFCFLMLIYLSVIYDGPTPPPNDGTKEIINGIPIENNTLIINALFVLLMFKFQYANNEKRRNIK